MHSALQDIRVALRQVGRHRGFSTIVVVTLALGIGATTTFFTLLNGFVFRPLPYTAPDRLVTIQGVEQNASRGEFRLAHHTFSELTRTTGVLESAVAYDTRQYNAAIAENVQRIEGTAVSGDVFSTLGVPLATGRPFTAAEHRVGAPVVIVSHAFWTRHAASHPAILGQPLALDGTSHVIVGVAAPYFDFPGGAQVWLPLAPPAHTGTARRVGVAARLRDGVSIEQASAALQGAAAHFGPEHRASNADWRPAVVPLREALLTDKHRNAVGVLFAAAALVLVVACANLAGLLMAHVAGRRHEIAIRSAVGARRSRIVRLLLTESLVLAAAGGALGILAAQWGIDLFLGTLGKPKGLEWLEFPIDARVVLFALIASVVTAVMFGLAPALGATRVDLRRVLQDDAQGQATPGGRRLRVALVAAQIAVSVGLIAGASSIVTSSLAAQSIDPGFNRERLLWLRVTLAGPSYDNAAQRLAFVDAASQRLGSLPGVSAVTAVSHLPLVDRQLPHALFMLEGWTPDGHLPYAPVRFASSNYLQVLGLRLRRGRFFVDSETRDPNVPPVAVINETMANRNWAGGEAVGRRLRVVSAATGDVWLTVIGVVGDVAQRGVLSPPENQIYLPLPHTRDLTLAVRATHNPAALIEPARRALASIDPSLPVTAGTMDQTYAWHASDRLMQASVVGALGTVALALAALGIYAVMALFVTQQQREIAVRMALGATRGATLRLVLLRGARVVAFGLGGGLLFALCVTTGLSWIFYGVRPFDPAVILATTLLLALVGLFASWWPARRAMRVDPMTVLQRR